MPKKAAVKVAKSSGAGTKDVKSEQRVATEPETRPDELDCVFESMPKHTETSEDDLMARINAHQAGTDSHRKATVRGALQRRIIEHARESLQEGDWLNKESLWERAKDDFDGNFNKFLLARLEEASAKEKLQASTKAVYSGVIDALRLHPTAESLEAAEKQLQGWIAKTATQIDADERITPEKAVPTRDEAWAIINEPRQKGTSTAQQDAAEPFLFVFVWLLFVTGGRCENLWNAGPVTFLEDRVLVHWARRKGGRHHPRCATPYLYSWTDLAPPPPIIATIKRIVSMTKNRAAIPWTALAGCGGKVDNPSQKMNNWMKKCPSSATRDVPFTPGCARDFFTNKLFAQRLTSASKIDNNLYQFLSDHSVGTALVSYIDLNRYFSEEEAPAALVEVLTDANLSWLAAPEPKIDKAPEQSRAADTQLKDLAVRLEKLEDFCHGQAETLAAMYARLNELEGKGSSPRRAPSVTEVLSPTPAKKHRAERTSDLDFLGV